MIFETIHLFDAHCRPSQALHFVDMIALQGEPGFREALKGVHESSC